MGEYDPLCYFKGPLDTDAPPASSLLHAVGNLQTPAFDHAPPHSLPVGDCTRERWLSRVLWMLGLIDLAALFAVVAPAAWIVELHRQLGLGGFPTEPIGLYLARSASAMYALHGAMTVFVASDVRRYGPLIRFFAAVAIVHGILMLGIDLAGAMPLWWTFSEGPVFALTGAVVLLLSKPSKPEIASS